MTTTTDIRQFEELAYRESDGIEVSLLWRRAGNAVLVRVVDTKRDGGFELHARPDRALDAFHHPFAYAALVPRDGTALPAAHSA